MPSYIRTLAIASSLLILSGCGLKGELYMPQEYYDELKAEQLRIAAEQAAIARPVAANVRSVIAKAGGTYTYEAPAAGDSFDAVSDERLARQPVEDLLAAMPEGRVPEVMSERDGARQMDIQSQSLGNRRADRLDVQDVLHAGADMIVFHVGEYLCLVLESSERRRVQDPCIVTVETVAQRIPLIERLLSFGQRVVALGARHGGDAGKLRCIHGATSLYFHCNILWRD